MVLSESFKMAVIIRKKYHHLKKTSKTILSIGIRE